MARPNVLFIMSDDHAAHAMGCYGSRINKTPNLDRIAEGGMRFDNCFCTNSICTPSRAAILTGLHNHVNGVTTLATPLDNTIVTFPELLHRAGYQTAVFGKWHLGLGPKHCPGGFYDDWAILPGQGYYHNPDFLFRGPEGGVLRAIQGYATDIITDLTLDWLRARDRDRPFCLLYHHKAPHRPWEPDEKHAHLYLNEDIAEPETLYDDYAGRRAAKEALMRVGVHMFSDDTKCGINRNMPEDELRAWAYQRYIKDYLRVIASVDDNVGRVLDYMEADGIAEDTIVVYTSDQGFFLGDHGWYDKRFMYEESLRMPYVMRYPGLIQPGSANADIVTNLDFAPTFLDLAGAPTPDEFQGRSLRPLLEGRTPEDWPEAMYYRYWMNRSDHNVAAHYGIRTKRYKLIYFYAEGLGQLGSDRGFCVGDHVKAEDVPPLVPEWQLFDLETDPHELANVYADPAYADVARDLRADLRRLQTEAGDVPHPSEVA